MKLIWQTIGLIWILGSIILLTNIHVPTALIIMFSTGIIIVIIKSLLTRKRSEPPGQVPSWIKTQVLERQKNQCANCQTNFGSYDFHHIVPRSGGGTNNLYNICALCPNCHAKIHRGNNNDGK